MAKDDPKASTKRKWCRSWMGISKKKDRPESPTISPPELSRRLTINHGEADNWRIELDREVDKALQNMKRREREGISDSMCYESQRLLPPVPPMPKQIASSSIYPSKEDIDAVEVPEMNRAKIRDSTSSEKRLSWLSLRAFLQRRNDSVTDNVTDVYVNPQRASWTESLFKRKSRDPTKRSSLIDSENQTVLSSDSRKPPTPTAPHLDLALSEDRPPLEAEASQPLSPSLARSRPLYSSPPPLPIKHPGRNQQPEGSDGEPSSSSQPTPHDQWMEMPEEDSD